MKKILKDLIQDLDYKNLSTQEVYDKLNEKNIQYIDDSFWTWAGIAELVGNQGAEALRLALNDGGMGWAIHQLGGKGINLSKDDVQNALYYLHSIGVPGMSLLALTVKRNINLLEQNELTNPSLEEIDLSLNELRLNYLKNILEEQAWDRFQAYKIALTNYDGIGREPEL
jgi:hypothetical protein